jgi:transcription initiation factor IIE alpha subunit
MAQMADRMNLDRERIYIQCPRCHFHARPFLRQVRNQDTLICGGCKSNIHLVDYLGQYRKAERQIRRALEDLTDSLRDLNITIKI